MWAGCSNLAGDFFLACGVYHNEAHGEESDQLELEPEPGLKPVKNYRSLDKLS